MSTQIILAFVFGVLFLGILLVVAIYLVVRKDDKPVPPEAMFIFRIILALAGAAFGAILPGFLNIQTNLPSFVIQAGGALAVFVVIYLINPPSLIKKKIAKPKKPVKHPVRNRPQQLADEGRDHDPSPRP